MIIYSFTIETKYKQDLIKIKELLKQRKTEYELIKHSNSKGASIQFESDYNEEDLFSDIDNIFPLYEKRKSLSTGRFDILLQINIYRSPLNSDNWGRPINSEGIEENIYYLIEEKEHSFNVRIKQLNTNFFAGVTSIRDVKNNKIGFATYLFPPYTVFRVNQKDGQRLTPLDLNEWHSTEQEAFAIVQPYFNKDASKDSNHI